MFEMEKFRQLLSLHPKWESQDIFFRRIYCLQISWTITLVVQTTPCGQMKTNEASTNQVISVSVWHKSHILFDIP